VENTRQTLLLRARAGESEAWQRLVALYQPLIHTWVLRSGAHTQDADDVTQDVLAVLVKELSRFEHAGRVGSFRSWLRTITVNQTRKFWNSGRCRARAVGGSGILEVFEQLEDASSEPSRQWDADHDLHVYCRLLEFLEQEFEPATVRIFRRLVVDGARAAEVAAESEMSVAAVYASKSRVLKRLREEAEGLLD
jgi:RNA polymerase sigma-70 factor (ECF subfamily)